MTNRTGCRLNVPRHVTLGIAAIAAFALPVAVRAMNTLPAQAADREVAARDAVALTQQAPPDRRPRFEVASIRPCEGTQGKRDARTSPGRLTVTCHTLATLIRLAYIGWSPSGLGAPIVGGPGWLDSDEYLIDARTASEQPVAMIGGPMLQALLEERFMLKIRRETQELPHYALTVANGGSKLRPIDPASCVPPDLTKPPAARDLVTQKPFCGRSRISPSGVTGASMTVEELTTALRSFVDRPIVNKTGIAGMFDINLQFAPLASPEQGGGNDPAGRNPAPAVPTGGGRGGRGGGGRGDGGAVVAADVTIFTALQEQLGLRLERTTGPVPSVLVIDHAERPSAN